MSRVTKEKRAELDLRGESIRLDPLIAYECISEKQQDIMLKLQYRVDLMKMAYEYMQTRTANKPTRDYAAAQKKLEDLKEYAFATFDFDSYFLLEQVILKEHRPYAKKKRDEFMREAESKMLDKVFSPSRKKKLLEELMRYFDTHEVSEETRTKIENLFNNPLINPNDPPKLKLESKPSYENDHIQEIKEFLKTSLNKDQK